MKIIDKTSVRVQMLDGYVEGIEGSDWLCLDNEEDVCIENYQFIFADTINYKHIKSRSIEGVISFGQYSKDLDKCLVNTLYDQRQFSKNTLQLDFNLWVGIWNGVRYEIHSNSSVTFNGVNADNLPDDYEFHMMDN